MWCLNSFVCVVCISKESSCVFFREKWGFSNFVGVGFFSVICAFSQNLASCGF